MKMAACLLALSVLVAARDASAQVFDTHVHLWHGERSLRDYEASVRGLGDVAFGGMWFGGQQRAVAAGDILVNPPFGEHGLENRSGADIRLLVFQLSHDAVPGAH